MTKTTKLTHGLLKVRDKGRLEAIAAALVQAECQPRHAKSERFERDRYKLLRDCINFLGKEHPAVKMFDSMPRITGNGWKISPNMPVDLRMGSVGKVAATEEGEDRSPRTPARAGNAPEALGTQVPRSEPAMTLYLIQVWGDVEPHLYGPFETEEARDAEARKLHAEDEGTLLRVDIESGRPEVYAFAYGELGDEED